MKSLIFNILALSALSALGMGASSEKTKPEKATFAGGCFWCMEAPLEKIDGIYEVISGYTGGHKENPTYKEVCSGTTGHLEAVQILFDPEKISYEKLLEIFWRQFDPTDGGGSFGDRGHAVGRPRGPERGWPPRSLDA